MTKTKFFLSFILLFLATTPAQATLVKAVNLQTLSDLAKVIVKAKVLDEQTELDTEESQQMVHYYTLDVLDVVKGDVSLGELVIKQVADGSYEDRGVILQQRFRFPRYEVGKTYLFFLPEAHPETGLMAPIALSQGIFPVVKTQDGVEQISGLKKRMKWLQGESRQLSGDKRTLFLQKTKSLDQDQSYTNFKQVVQGLLR